MAYFTFNTNIPLPRTAEELQDRIKSLFAIRTELDREIESLMGVKAEAAKPYHCVRCDYKWKSRLAHRPKMCPRCRIKKFDRPPLYTYEEKIARKKELSEQRDQYKESFEAYVKQTGEELRHPPIEIPSLAPMPHSVLTRQISTEADSIQNVMLTPPPEPDRPLSLRERLAMLKSQSATESESDTPFPLNLSGSNGAATDGAHLESNESVTEDELMEAINGDEE